MWSILSAIIGGGVKALLAYFLPSKEERLGKAETELSEQKEARNVQNKIDSVQPLRPDGVADKLRDGKF